MHWDAVASTGLAMDSRVCVWEACKASPVACLVVSSHHRYGMLVSKLEPNGGICSDHAARVSRVQLWEAGKFLPTGKPAHMFGCPFASVSMRRALPAEARKLVCVCEAMTREKMRLGALLTTPGGIHAQRPTPC